MRMHSNSFNHTYSNHVQIWQHKNEQTNLWLKIESFASLDLPQEIFYIMFTNIFLFIKFFQPLVLSFRKYKNIMILSENIYISIFSWKFFRLDN